jgi:tRNA dimethylallyltransferase
MKKADSVIVIAGPTACGKSTLAMDLAEKYKGCIINADSLQVYKDLTILTARPSSEDLSTAPHKLYGIIDSEERFSVARWRDMALHEIDCAIKNDMQPIIVGGTGLYLQALMHGISAVPTIPQEIFQQILDDLEQKGLDYLYDSLSKEDPVMAHKLHPNNSQRIIRALSVIRATGKSLSTWHQQDKDSGIDITFLKLLILPDREELNHLADARFDLMMAKGAVQEVQKLMEKGYPRNSPIFKALGVAQLMAHLENTITLDEAIGLTKIATRQYIKRQFTWFRHQFEADVTLSFPYSHQHLSSIQEFLNKDQHF